MSDDEDYNSEEDVDYVPVEGEQVSEEENSGDDEDLSILHDADNPTSSIIGKRKTAKKKNLLQPRKRKGGIKLEGQEAGVSEEQNEEDEEEKARRKELAAQIAKEEEEKKKEKEKKRADDLWASFMSDVKPINRKPTASGESSGLGALNTQVSSTKGEKKESANEEKPEPGKNSKITITKVFDFAGEEVKITKEVDADSKEAKDEQKKQEKAKEEEEKQKKTLGASSILSGGPSLGSGLKRPAPGGLGSVLSKIGKKNKMGTLEKSKMDWESFKKKEGIEEDLKIHNKGKQGYTERMAFLNRADQREYEIERDLRLSTSKR